MNTTSVTREAPDGTLFLELYVCYEKTYDTCGDPAARLVQVDDELRGYEGVEEDLPAEELALIREKIGLPLLEPQEWEEHPRYWRDGEGRYHRIAYWRHTPRYWIGGKGYVHTPVVSVWKPEQGYTKDEAGRGAAPGEQFALMFSSEDFERKAYPPEDLPPIGREAAREHIERAARERPGSVQRVRFVKRTNGELRVMRFRLLDGERAKCTRFQFDPKAKGLLPVYDVEKQVQRFVNLDGVRTVGDHRPAPA